MAWYDKWAIMAIAAAIGLAGYHGVPWCKMDVTIWAYWVASIGTTGTLVGTIWLATSETRTRNARDLAIARITASALRPRVLEVEHICKNVCKMLTEISNEFPSREIDAKKICEVGIALGIVPMWNVRELMPLAALPSDCAERLAGAHGLIATTASLLKNTQTAPGKQDEIVKFIISNVVMLEIAIKFMHSASSDMRAAISATALDME